MRRERKRYNRAVLGILAFLVVFCMILAPAVKKVNSFITHAASSLEEGPIEEIFPESYQEALLALQKEHPDWVFKAFKTGLSWDDCFGRSGRYSESEMTFTANLAALGEHPSSWYATTIPGSFNWAANAYNVLSAPYWVQASEEAIRYCMDPRNFLTEQQIFQFEDTSFAEYQSLEGVQRILAGTFMEDELIENESGGEITYAEAFMDIGRSVGVSPYLLAARIRQEQGCEGTSPLISGTYEFLVNGKKVSGYYDYFNITASGETYEEIYQNGLMTAYENGWDTRYKALFGGAQKLFNRYIADGQTTLYFQKFNVNSSSSRLFWGQYMQAIIAPQSEAKSVYRTYNELEALDSPIVFVIPVFSGMPKKPEPEPEKDGNPNYKLGMLSYKVEGMVGMSVVSGFTPDTYDYVVRVPDTVDEVHLFAVPFASSLFGSKSTTTVNGSLESFSTVVKLMEVKTVYQVTAVAENSDTAIYQLTFVKDPDVKITEPETTKAPTEPVTEPETEPETEAPTEPATEAPTEPPTTEAVPVTITVPYAMTKNTIKGIAPQTTAGTFTEAVTVSVPAALTIKDASGNIVASSDKLATGMILSVSGGEDYLLVVKADINGDGAVSLRDMLELERHILGYEVLNGYASMAADVNGDGKISLLDMLQLERHLLGYEILK